MDVTIQSKRDPSRIETIPQEQWGKMVELGLHRKFKVLQTVEISETPAIKEVSESIADFIAKKKSNIKIIK